MAKLETFSVLIGAELKEELSKIIEPDYIDSWALIPSKEFAGKTPYEFYKDNSEDGKRRIKEMIYFCGSGIAR